MQNERNPLFATTIEMEYHFEQTQVGARERAREEHECVSIIFGCLHVVIACGVRMHIDFPPGMVHRKSASTFWMSTTPRRTLARLT